jgi:P4 family phage/plasmid primase-like protien
MPQENIGSAVKSFYKFIGTHVSYDKATTTHTTMGEGSNCGKYNFVGDDYQKFLDKYIAVLNSEAEVDLNFVERPNSNGVTYFFIDVDYEHDGKKRMYTDKHIKQIIDKTNEFLRDHFNVTKNHLITFVTEKPEPTKRKNSPEYKDGFHIYYPNLPMEEKHRYYVTDYLKTCMANDEFLDGIKYKNETENIFDASVVRNNGILMYGSKKPGCHPYKLTRVYDSKLRSLGIEEYDYEELVHTLSNQKYDVDAKIEVVDDKEILQDIEKINAQYNGGNKKKILNDKHNRNNRNENYDDDCDRYARKTSNDPKINNVKKEEKRKTPLQQKELEMAVLLCKILDGKRARDYKSWRRVGFVMRSIDDSLYNEYVEFSKKEINKYNEGKVTCRQVWDDAANYCNFSAMGTLRHWARTDNPKKYNDIIRRIYDNLFGKAETNKHVDIAEVVHALYKDRFVCVDIAKKKWYEYQSHKWVAVQSAYTFEELISLEIRNMLAMHCSEKLRKAVLENDDGFNSDYEHKKYQKLLKLTENLGDVKFRENVVRACANKFFDPNFQTKLDANVYLVGFENGIYDLKEMCFRDGLPTDYVSKTVGYDWKEFNENDKIFEKINKFFSEVQINEDMREYLFTFIAKILRGIPDSKLHIWTGGGGNGKSVTIDLLKHMLGEYFGTVPVTILTKKRNSSGSASPELADKFGKRLLVVNETEHNDVIFVGQMKEYTGKDLIMARPLYGDPFYFVPQFTMILTCNNLPSIPATDKGTWRRLRVTPFESEFVNEPTKPNQFMIDEELQEEFPEWRQPLMWLIMTKYYPIYHEGIAGKRFKIKEPAKVLEYTTKYKLDSDFYADFLKDNIECTQNDNDTESIPFLFQTFRDWFTGSFSEKPPAKKDFIDYLKKNDYKLDKKCVKMIGYKYALGSS